MQSKSIDYIEMAERVVNFRNARKPGRGDVRGSGRFNHKNFESSGVQVSGKNGRAGAKVRFATRLASR